MISVSSVRKALRLLLIVAVIPGSGSAQQGAREAMADGMARMMEAMGLFDPGPARQSIGGVPTNPMSMMDPLSASGWGPALGMPSGSPVQDPSRAFAMQESMQQFARRMGWKPSQLEGVWEGRDGELLIVQGSRFRLYSPAMQQVNGLLRIQGNRLALYNPLDRHAQPFEFAQSQGRLIMRDLAGQAYLYRRLRLDGGQPRAANPNTEDK